MSLNRLITSQKTQKSFLVFAALVMLITFIQMFGKAYRPDGYDFTSYLLATQAFFQGNSPYLTPTKFPYLYPLFPCVCLSPLTIVPYAVANALWFFINLFSLMYSLFIIQPYISSEKSTWKKVLWCVVVFILLLNIARNNLLNGQINFLVIALCALFFKALQEKHLIKSSVYLAAAIATKLTPVIFIFYLLFNKQYKTGLLTILFSFLFAIFLPAFIVGPEKIFIFYQHYLAPLKANALLPHPHHILLSLPSIFNAIFHHQATALLTLVSAAALLIALFFLQKRSAPPIILFSLYMIAPLLISPMSETHHLANIFIPLLVALRYQTTHPKLNRYLLIISVLLLWLGSIFAYGYFLSTVLLIFSLITFQKPNLSPRAPNAHRDFHIL